MIFKVIRWILSPSSKPITEEHINFYDKIIELEEKYNAIILNVKNLEEENIETTNTLYEIMNCLDALDARIDILAEHFGGNSNV